MPRSSNLSSLFGSLIATAAVCVAFAAYCAPSEMSGLTTEPEAGCAEKASANASTSAADQQPGGQVIPCDPQARTAELDDRAYILETASPGTTMTMQGPELAIARLNPQFVARLASAIRDARQSGLPNVGIFSAYRPPALGIGGFLDKFRSLHSYGLAVDMTGIGDPGSQDAKLWHDIAARHGVFCPYSIDSRTEWNHCQATPTKGVPAHGPLRETITAQGPIDLAQMFKVGDSLIADLPKAISVAEAINEHQGSAAVRVAAASPSESVHLTHLRQVHQARNHLSEALARHGRNAKSKTIMVAKNEARGTERSHEKRGDEAKAHAVRKTARTPAERDRDTPRRRSHVA